MSTSLIVDQKSDDLPGNADSARKALEEAVTTEEKPAQEAPAEENSQIPEKYRGKTLEEVIEMHKNAESELGRKGNEIGQYKSLTDQLLELKRSDDLVKGGADPEDIDKPKVEVSSTELLDDPTAAVEKVVKANLEYENRKRQIKDAETAQQEQSRLFAEKHPDAEQIANDPKFIEWVQNSPSRSVSAVHAAQGDLVSGDALLTEWKSLKDEAPAEEAPKEDANIQAARAASTESTGASNASEAPKGKTYRRIDLIRLKLEDPEAYGDPAFQNEIMRAYAEGRVK